MTKTAIIGLLAGAALAMPIVGIVLARMLAARLRPGRVAALAG